ncbi:MAG TPA: transcriptional regulator [Pelagibacterium sp.]|uniref:winged helix-turn-helix transcriptional regulator n=1 Tax=uncultured Pelagibacterium sp. TaxID=1159875 RepID=UPI000C67E262|nr:transcriptional regulator [Pelagibacterium sp.]HCO55564.1 transcriptional regulator [Pelagibacterium sp.]|tara:strand:- start:6668 stop:7069 length:402 start_codon:yes stop_codon:yes gene_type:complete
MAGIEPDEATVCTAMGDILNRIGDKWSVMVVGRLKGGTMRFSELRRAIDGVSQRMLTLTLRNLERDGLVTRTVYAEIPPRVEYTLTEMGRTLTGPIGALWDWAAEHQDQVARARIHYDRAQDGAAIQPERRRA